MIWLSFAAGVAACLAAEAIIAIIVGALASLFVSVTPRYPIDKIRDRAEFHIDSDDDDPHHAGGIGA